jgi:hypothetical protein
LPSPYVDDLMHCGEQDRAVSGGHQDEGRRPDCFDDRKRQRPEISGSDQNASGGLSTIGATEGWLSDKSVA